MPIQISQSGTAYAEGFDTLSNTAGTTTNSDLPFGWVIEEGGLGARDNEQYAVDTGASATGDVYSYGTSGSTDRALGQLRSGSLVPLIGASFQNDSGSTILSLTIAYTGEQWRVGGTHITVADKFDFQISFNATSVSDAGASWTDVDALDFNAPTVSATGAALDGNLSANRTSLSFDLTGLAILAGQTFWIRWVDTDSSGGDDGLAIDDFSIIATTQADADYAVLQFPTALAAEAGTDSILIYGRVFEAGVTEAAGAPAGITAQIGYGPAGTDPRIHPNWVWFDATYNLQAGNNDEFQGTIVIPDAPGSYAYTYRFILDGGAAYSYADLDGSGTDAGLSFSTGQLGTLTVNAATPRDLTGTPDPDVLDGAAEDDELSGLAGDDLLDGRGGDDQLDGGTGEDSLTGGTGNDLYFVDDMGDVVTELAGEGIDTVSTAIGSKTPPDRLVYDLPEEVENLIGTSTGNQGVRDNSLDNLVTMAAGHDLVVADGGGVDKVDGGAGNDFIYFGDTLTPDDMSIGGSGVDTLGLLGNYDGGIQLKNTSLSGMERMAMYSGLYAASSSAAAADAVFDPFNYHIIMDDSNVAAGTMFFVTAASLQPNESLTFDGSAEIGGRFTVHGGAGNDTMTGGTSSDFFIGNAGNDTLNGLGGADFLIGGAGADLLSGGAGADSFRYASTLHSSAANPDQILDFEHIDRIDLSAIDANGNPNDGDQAFVLVGSFTGVAGELRAFFTAGVWFVEGDTNGDSVADLVIQGPVVGDVAPILPSDFIL